MILQNHELIEEITYHYILDKPTINIERCGRISYKSNSELTKESAKTFIIDRIKAGHLSVLEHGVCAFTVNADYWVNILSTMNGYKSILEYDVIPYIKYKKIKSDQRLYFVIINYRAAYNLINEVYKNNISALLPFVEKLKNVHTDKVFNKVLAYNHPPIINDIPTYTIKSHNISLFITQIADLLPYTLIFNTNRGVTHELVRHRKGRFVQESTRFCNYSKDRFDNNITYIDGSKYIKGKINKFLYKSTLYFIEKVYMYMIKHGVTAQIARGILPNDLKSTIAITAYNKEWNDIFTQRESKSAHPHMQELIATAGFTDVYVYRNR